jgi:hypothetical protein
MIDSSKCQKTPSGMVIGCGKEPCRCAEMKAQMERIFSEDRAESFAQLEADLAAVDLSSVKAGDPLNDWLS